MHSTCYILYSKVLDKYYIGFTNDSLENRLEKHRNGYYNRSFSKITNDWDIFFFIICECASQTLAIEKHIKKMKSKAYIQNLKRFPEISEKLKLKYPCS
ncbi:MAG: GIY-YIG nuclease family protein [Chitinophagaceae bacterium]|nr:MAG: GIY-YIG nuclease family protein [Chitinophagaceae bacterium]